MALQISRGVLSASDLLETEIETEGTHAVVVLAGEVDISTVGKLYEELAELARANVCHIALNVAEVTFIDSTGLSLLVTEHKRAESMNGELLVFSPTLQLVRLLQITGLDAYLNIRPRLAVLP
jgi:anti-anti-sigma factor